MSTPLNRFIELFYFDSVISAKYLTACYYVTNSDYLLLFLATVYFFIHYMFASPFHCE